jgi:hypothetical protein
MGKTSLSHCASMQVYCGQLNIAFRKHHLTGAQEMASHTMHSKTALRAIFYPSSNMIHGSPIGNLKKRQVSGE